METIKHLKQRKQRKQHHSFSFEHIYICIIWNLIVGQNENIELWKDEMVVWNKADYVSARPIKYIITLRKTFGITLVILYDLFESISSMYV